MAHGYECPFCHGVQHPAAEEPTGPCTYCGRKAMFRRLEQDELVVELNFGLTKALAERIQTGLGLALMLADLSGSVCSAMQDLMTILQEAIAKAGAEEEPR